MSDRETDKTQDVTEQVLDDDWNLEIVETPEDLEQDDIEGAVAFYRELLRVEGSCPPDVGEVLLMMMPTKADELMRRMVEVRKELGITDVAPA